MAKYAISKKKQNKQNLNEASRRLKKKRKHKGLPNGHRHSLIMIKKKKDQHQTSIDPKLGSKKLIPLINDEAVIQETTTVKKPVAMQLSPEQELEKLENDPKLEQYLVRIEAGETLTDRQQDYLDNVLSRIDTLMTLLGYEDNDHGNKDDIMKLLKQ